MGTIFGQFELLEELGDGSMAKVFRARSVHHPEIGPCVVKQIRSEFMHDTNLMARFVEGAQLVVGLEHPNIPKVIEAGSLVGKHYVALQHVHGKNLLDIQKQFKATSSALPNQLAVHLTAELCKALHFVHNARDNNDNRLVHCDVSPANIMVSFSGTVKLINFEDAWFRMKGWAPTRGKLAYMSPEQLAGHLVDQRADIFAVGVVLWEIGTGKRLFDGKTDDDVRQQVEAANIPSPTGVNSLVPNEMEQIILKALAPDPAERFQSAAEMYYALDDFATKTRLSFSTKQLGSWLKMTFPGQSIEDHSDLVLAPPPPRPNPAEAAAIVLEVKSAENRFELEEKPPVPVGQDKVETDDASHLDEAMKERRALSKRIDDGENIEVKFEHLENRRTPLGPDDRRSMVQILVIVGAVIAAGLALVAYLKLGG